MTAAGHAQLPGDILANPRLGTWFSCTEDGRFGIRVGKVELGQGILTALTQVAADALDVGADEVVILTAHTALGPDEGLTAGSLSIPQAGAAVRHVGTVVRDLVARLSREHPDQPPRELRRLIDVDTDLTEWTPSAPEAPVRRLVGVDLPRLDLPDKVLGRPRFLSDLRPDGLAYGRVVRPPSVGALLVELDSAALDGLNAIRVVRDGSFLGVVADTEAAADVAAKRLASAARWDERDALPDENDLDAFLRAGPHVDIDLVDEPGAPTPETATVRATFSRPFLLHASMAPSCGVARWASDGSTVQLWSHSQGIHRLRDAVAAALRLEVDAVTVEHVESAGCYGHNAADDAAFDAVLLARAVPGRPVQVRWSRRDEMTWAPLASAMTVDVAATVTDGMITGWRHEVWSQGHTSRPGYAGVPGLLAGHHLADPLSAPAAADSPPTAGGGTTRNAVPLYDLGPRRILGHRLAETPLRTSAMRALGAYTNVFAIESFLDELAATVGADPLEFRLRHLSDPRAVAVLEEAARAASWGTELPEDSGRGIGFARYKDRGAYCAVVAEVAVDRVVRVRRLTIAVDVGRVVSPDGVRNQIEGGATQATSWTTKERVRFDRRRITSDDWESYPILLFSEAPAVDVVLLDRPELPSLGAGEAAQGPTAAAIANAVHAALGVRVRHLPLTAEAVVRAIEEAD